ncbi:MAG: DUF971 domain-containing protein [Planctomycetes bacterium]|nr:DUF971 domain-containing protein [Planctomycetota bacterium]
MTTPHPTALKLNDDNRLLITFSDNVTKSYRIRELRDACPCATCREKRTAAAGAPSNPFAVFTPEELRPLTIRGMEPVGSYAYKIDFSDGHDTGIYTLERLRELGRELT